MKNAADYNQYECPYAHLEKEFGHNLQGPEGFEDTYGVWCACGFRGPVFYLDPEQLGLKKKGLAPSTSAEPAVAQREPECATCGDTKRVPKPMNDFPQATGVCPDCTPDPQPAKDEGREVVGVDRDLLEQAAEHEFAYDYRDDRNYCTACRVFQAKTALPSNDHAKDCWRVKLQAVLAAWDRQQRAQPTKSNTPTHIEEKP